MDMLLTIKTCRPKVLYVARSVCSVLRGKPLQGKMGIVYRDAGIEPMIQGDGHASRVRIPGAILLH